MIRPLFIALTLAAALPAAPAMANQNTQLVLSAQSKLDRLGFQDVDAATLTLNQLATLHLLRSRDLAFGTPWIKTRQRVKVLLGLHRSPER